MSSMAACGPQAACLSWHSCFGGWILYKRKIMLCFSFVTYLVAIFDQELFQQYYIMPYGGVCLLWLFSLSCQRLLWPTTDLISVFFFNLVMIVNERLITSLIKLSCCVNVTVVNKFLLVRTSNRRHLSCDDRVEDKREDFQNCSVLLTASQVFRIICPGKKNRLISGLTRFLHKTKNSAKFPLISGMYTLWS